MLRKGYRWPHHLTINAYWFGVSFMWNSLHPIILPVLLLSLAPEEMKNTSYGMLTFVGLLVALVVQPISGALSDHTYHALGRRRPWILLGTLLDVGCLLALALARNLWMAAIGYVLLQFTSNLAHGPGQGLIPDLVPEGKRGFASGVKNLFEVSGVISAALIMGALMGSADPQRALAMAIIAGILLATMTITLAGARERPASVAFCQRGSGLGRIRVLLGVDFRAHRDYARLLASRFCVLLGTYLVRSFGLYYFRDVLQAASPARAVSKFTIAIALSVTLAAYPAGALSERWGRRKLSLVACGLASLGMGLPLLVRNTPGLWILGCVIGFSMSTFASVNWAWATDLVPAAEAGKYLGLSNLATAGSAATASLFGPFIDLINARAPNAGYTAMFIVAALGALMGLIITLGVPETRARATCDGGG